MDLLFFVLIFVVPILLVIMIVRYFSLKGKYKEAIEIAQPIIDIKKYVEDKQYEGDIYLKDKKAEADSIVEKARIDNNGLLEKNEELKKENKKLMLESAKLALDIKVNSVKIDAYENMRSDEIKNKLSILEGKQSEMIKKDKAVIVSLDDQPKKIINARVKQILRSFNSECANILGSVTVKNVDTSRAKIQRSFDNINKIFVNDGVQIEIRYLESKFKELSLIYAYMVKEEEEKETRKAIREQMVEEEKVRKEIEREKAKLEKEHNQFTNEVSKLMTYMQKAKDDIERNLYVDKIKELEDKIRTLEEDQKDVLHREENTRAGFVYIISNIGSFGEDIYKIGMTRRLEPMDRISELSSASVPFPFDVHAMIFSDDAPGLENILHHYFDEKRVNKVNSRKEFFKVNLEEIKKVVLENHNATVKFIDIPEAEEYRETIKIEDSKN